MSDIHEQLRALLERAEVLVAGERGGSMAGKVFAGLGIAFLYKTVMSVLGLWKDVPQWTTARTSTCAPGGAQELAVGLTNPPAAAPHRP